MEAIAASNPVTHGAKGAKRPHPAKAHAELVRHIQNVAEKRDALREAKNAHDEHVRNLYRENGSTADIPSVNVF